MPRLPRKRSAPAHPDDVQMSFGEHLEELRRRLIYALLGVGVTGCLTFYYAQDLVAWLTAPLLYAYARAGLAPRIVVHQVMTGFTLYMKVGLVAATILAGPWVLYQLWRFVSAGLYAAERRVVLLIAPFSAAMTVLGVAFCYYILLPLALVFLIGFSTTYLRPATDPPPIERMMGLLPNWTQAAINWMNGVGPPPPATTAPANPGQGDAPASGPRLPVLAVDPPHPAEGECWVKMPEREYRVFLEGRAHTVSLSLGTLIEPLIEIDDYVDFVAMMMLGLVVAFQVPVCMLVAGWTGLLNPAAVSKSRKYYVFGAFVAAAILTPTGDPFNLTIMAVPLWLLFELGLIVMRLAHRRHGLRDAGAGTP